MCNFAGQFYSYLVKKNKTLFSEFPPVTTREWEEKILKDLRGADYDKKLIWQTPTGIRVKPYYRAEDLSGLEYLDIFPGDYPFSRGSKVQHNDWFIREDLQVDDIGKANKKALDILMKGVDSLGLVLDEKRKYTAKDLDQLLRNIFAGIVEINFVCNPDQAEDIMKIHYSLLEKYKRDFQKIYGSIDYAPLSVLATTGHFHGSAEEGFQRCKALLELAQHLPHFTVIAVNGTTYRSSGSSIVQELAFSLAEGAEYLTQVTELGVSIDRVAPNIKFNFGIGSNYFMEMAKIRAARYLWAKIVKAYGLSEPDNAKMNIHAVSTDWNKTLYDPHVNMLRTTTESMSAIIAGIDSLSVLPFDMVYEGPNDFALRIARNQQLLLKEESYLNKVVDPAAGSYYIESICDALIEAAWKLFLEVESKGGFMQAFRIGFIQEKVHQNSWKKHQDIATRKEILLGTNQYPNITERITKELNTDLFNSVEKQNKQQIGAPLIPYRAGQKFEALRYKTDLYSMRKARPKVFLFPFGNQAMRLERSQFSSNFFGCAGFDIIDNPGFNQIENGIKAVHEKDPDIVVVCSADAEYPVIIPEIIEKLGDTAIIVVAGYPKEDVEDLKKAGIEHFIHVRTNVLETLQQFQELLGIY